MLVSGALVRVFLTGVGFAAAPVQPCVLHEQQKLIPSDAGESFNVGASVSIDGDTAVVGAWRAIEGNVSSGAAYVLRRDGGCTPAVAGGECWYEEQKLISVDAVSGDLFGWSAAIGGERIVVGARFRTVDVRSGAAFVFRRDKNDTVLDPSDDFWVQESVLSASDAAPSDDFGNSVSISGDWAVVGAPKDDDACPELADCDSGSAYVFRRDDNGTAFDPGDDYWVEEGKLTTPTTVFGDNFGYSVAISGDWAIVGAWQSDINGMESGAAYAFRRVDNDTPADPTDDFWIWDDVLLPEDGAAFDEFGFDVGIDGDRAVVGSWLDDDDGNQSGSAYVFRLDDNDTPFDPTDDLWLEEDKLRADDATAGDEFGKSVSLDGETIVVGSFEDDDACEAEGDPDPHCDSGSAYVFRYTDNGTPLDPGDDHWTQTAKLIASDGATRHFFGRVDVSGQTVIAGSLDDEAGPSAGAAYLYTIALECADLLDIADFQTCILGDGGGVLIGCEVFDLDADLDVDLDDYRLLAPALTGP
jgi:hypothetical protein